MLSASRTCCGFIFLAMLAGASLVVADCLNTLQPIPLKEDSTAEAESVESRGDVSSLLHASWQDARRNPSEYRHRVSQFVGFLEGRLGVPVPNWWRQRLAMQLESQSKDYVHPITAPPHPYLLTRDSVGEDGFMTVAVGSQEVRLPAKVLPADGSDFGIAVAVERSRCYVVTYGSLESYRLNCFNPNAGEVLWRSELDTATRSMPKVLDPVEIAVGANTVVVFAASDDACHLHQFDSNIGMATGHFTTLKEE